MIPFWQPEVDLPEVKQHLDAVVSYNWPNEGIVTAGFEERMQGLLGVKHAIAVTSGTVALYLALKACGIGHGDEVIVPDCTFIATANAVRMTGAQPVLVDVSKDDLMIDLEKASEAATSRTKAVIPVHLSGACAWHGFVAPVREREGLIVIEDACQALCSRSYNRYLGTIGAMGCFSFSPNKILTTGQGGMVVTNDDGLAARVRELKDQGRSERGTGGDDIHGSVGFNFKFTDLQAAVGLGQLSVLGQRVARLMRNRQLYVSWLSGTPGIRLLPAGDVPLWTTAECERRDELFKFLAEKDIHCRKMYRPLHTQGAMNDGTRLELWHLKSGCFPVAEKVMPRCLWLPSAYTLTDDEVLTVCQAIKEFYSRGQA